MKLGNRQKAILFDAGRRLKTFHESENFLTAWAGLGMPSVYKTVVNADLMRPISREVKGCAQWYVLTEKGLSTVIELGYLEVGKPTPPELMKHVLQLD